MVNRNYVKGRAFEHAVRKHYESKGYTVIRSAGSKGAIDLIAWSRFDVRFVNPEHEEKLLKEEKLGLQIDLTPYIIVRKDVRVIQCKLYGKKTTKPLRTDLELLRQVKVPDTWQRVLAWRVHGESKFKEEIV